MHAAFRLFQQPFMDETALPVRVFTPRSENPFEGLAYGYCRSSFQGGDAAMHARVHHTGRTPDTESRVGSRDLHRRLKAYQKVAGGKSGKGGRRHRIGSTPKHASTLKGSYTGHHDHR